MRPAPAIRRSSQPLAHVRSRQSPWSKATRNYSRRRKSDLTAEASMALRKHREGELVFEQTNDIARVRTTLERGGMIADGIEWPAACYLFAFYGNDPVGVIGVEP